MSWNVYFYQVCPICGRSLRICVEYLGRTVACRHCRGEFVARSANDPQPEPAEADQPSLTATDELAHLEPPNSWSLTPRPMI